VKTFKQFIFELTQREVDTAISAEKNIKYAFNRPGHEAPGYNYGGRLAPSRTGSGQVPEQTRVKQDLEAARIASQQRQQP